MRHPFRPALGLVVAAAVLAGCRSQLLDAVDAAAAPSPDASVPAPPDLRQPSVASPCRGVGLVHRGDTPLRADWATFVAGDLDGDGRADVLVARGPKDDWGGIDLLRNRGDGTLGDPTRAGQYPGDTHKTALRLADLDGDHLLDLVFLGTSKIEGPATRQGVTLGNGDGSFGGPSHHFGFTTERTGQTIWDVIVLDLESDGVLDLASMVDTPEIFTCRRAGTELAMYAQPLQLPDAPLPVRLTAGDFDGDGLADLAIARSLLRDQHVLTDIAVTRSHGDGFFDDAPRPIVTCGAFDGAATADFDRDGRDDLALACTATRLELHRGGGPDLLGPGLTVPGVLPTGPLVAGDLNGDGLPDLVLTTTAASGDGHALLLLCGRGDGTFEALPPVEMPPILLDEIALADFDGDGRLDVATLGRSVVDGGERVVSVFLTTR